MEISAREVNGVTVFNMSGRLDANTVEDVEGKITAAIDDGATKLILNMEGMDYISSVGLRVLVMAAKRISQTQGGLALCTIQDQVKEIFDLAGFSAFLKMFDDEESAVASFND